jgi:hypothetical protein
MAPTPKRAQPKRKAKPAKPKDAPPRKKVHRFAKCRKTFARKWCHCGIAVGRKLLSESYDHLPAHTTDIVLGLVTATDVSRRVSLSLTTWTVVT